jgi:hypothetical protein
MVWLEILWRQAFRTKRVIEPSAFLDANLTLGLFASLGLLVCLRTPERGSWLFTILVALTSATHVGGRVLAGLSGGLRASILFVQGVSLFFTALALVVLSSALSLRAESLTNVRYLPGLALSLFLHSSLEIQFFGPSAVRAWPVRRVALVVGVAGELIMAAALISHIAR